MYTYKLMSTYKPIIFRVKIISIYISSYEIVNS